MDNYWRNITCARPKCNRRIGSAKQAQHFGWEHLGEWYCYQCKPQN